MRDWDNLRYFLAVVREGSLAAAARSLQVAQPTVGRRMAAFEQELGARLFVATPGGQALSATGRKLVAQAELMEQGALAAERLAFGRDTGVRGKVCVTASEWFLVSVLGPLLGPLLSAHPELEIELLAEARHLNLVRREADIAIRPSKFEHQEVVGQRIGELSFGLYAADSYLARAGFPDFSSGCEGHALIGMSTSLSKVPDVEWLGPLAPRARIVARANGREPMLAMAVAGLGLVVLPRFLGDKGPGLRLIPTPTPEPRRPLWLGAHRDARTTPRIKVSVAFIAKSVAMLRNALCPSPLSSQNSESNATSPDTPS
jgi:DNA-binding transcriptional LysR family regulator